MAHPKRKISRTRRDKRRTHDVLSTKTLSVCAKTGEIHRRHRALVVNGDLIYKGAVVVENYRKVAE